MIGTVDSIKADANAQFLLQLGCLLSRSHSWKPTAKLRIFIPVAPGTDVTAAQKSFKTYFMELRINAVLVLVTVEYNQLELMDDDYVSWVNSLILSKKSGQTGVTFLQLPNTVDTCMGFISPEKGSASYLADLGPVVMTWGLKNVISV
ncbi:Oidioi.mRNA.OKI2018_I69.chr1.g2392.t1.cds [Oikopleura dioica]|uniref:Oidioi.mRNA.OKI2018_I69.chr1.g2392.t1.cds n=1 Tax=Oikopleura dioica TaxID=34765 RepID=A0ABN7SQX1_OIKDI|nr:Oidioi.mRNA.OKI2018_I69.chr1.g2392.t1.cds [Oikopleura dioica]